MSGLLSRRPGRWAVRLMIGAELLLFVTIVLVLESARTLDQTMIAIAGAFVLVAAFAFLFAAFGHHIIGRKRHGR